MPIQFIEDPEPIKLKEDVVANTARNNLGIRGLTSEMVKAGLGKTEVDTNQDFVDNPLTRFLRGAGVPTSMSEVQSMEEGLNPFTQLMHGSPLAVAGPVGLAAGQLFNTVGVGIGDQLGQSLDAYQHNDTAGGLKHLLGAENPLIGPQAADGNYAGALGTAISLALTHKLSRAGNGSSSPVEALSSVGESSPPTWGSNAASELGSYFKRKIPGYDAIKTAYNIVKGPKQPSASIPEPPTSGLAKLSLADPGADPSNLPAIPGAGLKKPMPATPNIPASPLSDIYSGQTPPTASASIGIANPDSFLSKVTSGYDSANPQITNGGQDVSPPFMGDAEFGMAKNGTATPPRNIGNKFLSSSPDPTKNIIGSKEEYLHADDAKPGRVLKRSPVVESEKGQSGGEPLVRVDSITPDKQAAIVSSKTKDGTWIQKTVPIRRFDLKPPKH